MKKVTLTNATVVPFYSSDSGAPAEIIRVIEPKEGFDSKMVKFNVEVPVKDTATNKAKLFEKCTIFAKGEDEVRTLQSTLVNGTLVEIEGTEGRFKGKTDPKTGKDIYYQNIVVTKVTPISNGVQSGQIPSDAAGGDEDLPF